jgi:transposase
MTYSLDLRQRVINFVKNGGSKVEASKRYEVGRDTVYRWLSGKNIINKQKLTRNRKIDTKLLLQRVKDNPDDRLIDHAQVFDVNINAIWYQFQKLGITRKKNSKIQGKEARTTYQIPANIT